MPQYQAFRTLTGEVLHRDVPLYGMNLTKTLSGATQMTGMAAEDVMTARVNGDRLLDEWGTTIVRVNDAGIPTHSCIMQPQTQWEAQNGVLNLVGPMGYFKGWYYDRATSWGPDPKKGLARPDPVKIFRSLIAYVQSVPDCDVGLNIIGATQSDVRIGDNEEPYRLQWWEAPDVGDALDNLASITPFDYAEGVEWDAYNPGKPWHFVDIGVPRLGKKQKDLRFEQGVNMRDPVPIVSNEGYCNDVLGIGNGEGSTMVHKRATRRDGRLRRTRIITDKTASQKTIDTRVASFLESMRSGIDIGQIVVDDHPYARISQLRVGDDIDAIGTLASYGDFDVSLRILAITIDEMTPEQATLTTALSSSFTYLATQEAST